MTEELKAEIENLEGIKLVQETALNKEYNIVEQLQKENEELKDKNKALEQYADLADVKVDEVESKLTEAKEIIRNLLRVTYGGEWNYSLEWKVKAGKFLKEVEK